ncbi:unnamed protein product [Arabis nemorensis]|uniref:PGG domain-containing protein n=1 Tax=Arabis nemorensis TaxID=586526 RepID=A0A565C6R5_9BRAS|nr:unnamed protein product [Arabis nemorensis]
MNLLYTVLFLTSLAPLPGASRPTPPNACNQSLPVDQTDSQLEGSSTLPSQSNRAPPLRANQTNTERVAPTAIVTPPSPARDAQGESNKRITPPDKRDLKSPFPMTATQSLAQINLASSSTVRSTQPVPPPAPLSSPTCLIQQGQCSQPNRLSQFHQAQPPGTPPIRIPWYHDNTFFAIEGSGQHGVPPNEFHRMDCLSICVLHYLLASGLSHTASWCQLPRLSTSIHIQCFLNQVAFSLLLLAHTVFPRTHPILAFIMDRLSFLLTVIAAYLASMPMFPPYIAIIMFLVVALVYMFARFRR